MPSIFRQTVAASLGLLALATTGLGAAETGGAEASSGSSDLAVLLQPTAASRPRRDQHGERPTPESLRDRLVVVSFVSVGCTIVCAVRTLDLDKLARALPEPLRGRVSFLALDTDPTGDDARDEAGRLRRFAEGLVGPTTPLRFLDADAAATAAIADRLRYPARALPEPPQTILVFDRRGQIAMTYGSDPLDAPRLRRDLAILDTFENGVGRPPRGTSEPAPTH
ncbi:MAG: hypothetical protein WAP03_05405 [Methylorubrum rhodinum]|jgi:protein SCO1/2|uniref:SCO family protein n=1 Tax=Methylorubrum rhodinum TaxID=29428 RepID=UPI003BAEF21F